MRKLVYEIYKGNEKINEVTSYNEVQEARKQGYTVKDKMVELHERWVNEIYHGDEKIGECTTNKDRKEAIDKGYTVKRVLRVS